jgi:hypothetical protein
MYWRFPVIFTCFLDRGDLELPYNRSDLHCTVLSLQAQADLWLDLYYTVALVAPVRSFGMLPMSKVEQMSLDRNHTRF